MEEAGIYHLEAEQAFVGAIFLEEELIKECRVLPEHLYSRKLRNLYKAMKMLDARGKPIDIISVVEQIGVQNLDEIGGISYISDLAASVPTTANFHFYEETVFNYYQKRKTIEVANRILDEAIIGDIHETLRAGVTSLMAIENSQTVDEKGEVQEALVDLYLSHEQDSGQLMGIPTGIADLDKLIDGLKNSDFIVIGARPSVGKTAFALHLAIEAAQSDVSVIFSMEMPKSQLLIRAMSNLGGINSLKMRNPRRNFAEEDWQKYSMAIGKLSNTHFHIFDKAGMNMNYIWSKVRKLKRDYGKEKRMLVVIDYLQLILGDSKHHDNRYAEISQISRTLKQMARELDVVVIALSQLSRGVESRQEKRPMLSDLRESGQIEQDADIITFLYRDDYYQRDSEQKDKMEIIVAKHRNGPVGTVKVGFEKEYGRFRGL